MAKRTVMPVWKILVIGVASILVLACLGGFFLVRSIASSADRDKEAIERLGYPTTIQAFIANLPPDDKDNAATTYLLAKQKFFAPGNPKRDFVDKAGKVDIPKRAAYLAKFEPAYQLIALASQKPHCTFPRDWDDPALSAFDETITMRLYAFLVSDRALHLSSKGDPTGALDTLTVGIRLSAHTNEPTPNALAAARGAEGAILQAFAQICYEHRQDHQFLTAARAWLTSLPPPPDHQTAFDFEIARFENVMAHIGDPEVAEAAHLEPDDEGWEPIRKYVTSDVGQAHIRRTFYHLARKFLEAENADLHQQYLDWKKIEDEFEREAFVLSKVATLLLPTFTLDARSTARAHDTRRLTDAALWVLEQTENGSRPKTLPNEPRFRDVWTGKPFAYAWTDNEFYVRSLGPNKRDDGGKSFTTESPDADDVEIRISL